MTFALFFSDTLIRRKTNATEYKTRTAQALIRPKKRPSGFAAVSLMLEPEGTRETGEFVMLTDMRTDVQIEDQVYHEHSWYEVISRAQYPHPHASVAYIKYGLIPLPDVA